MDNTVISTNSNRVMLKGILNRRIPASVVNNSSLTPRVVNNEKDTQAVVFIEENGEFFTDYIQLNPGKNNILVQYKNGENIVSSTRLIIVSK